MASVTTALLLYTFASFSIHTSLYMQTGPSLSRLPEDGLCFPCPAASFTASKKKDFLLHPGKHSVGSHCHSLLFIKQERKTQRLICKSLHMGCRDEDAASQERQKSDRKIHSACGALNNTRVQHLGKNCHRKVTFTRCQLK